MCKKEIGGIFWLILLTLFSTTVLAERERRAGQRQGRPDMIGQLNLDDKQVSLLEQIRLQHERERIKLRAEIELKMLDIREEILKENLDEGKVKKLAKEVSAMKSRLEELKIEKMIELRKVLTPQQVKKAAVFMGFFMGERGPYEEGMKKHWAPDGHGKGRPDKDDDDD